MKQSTLDGYQSTDWRDPDWLREKYHDEGLSLREIGDLVGISDRSIGYWMEKHDIPRRTNPDGNHRDAGWLREQYHGENLTADEMAEMAGVEHATILRWMDKHDIDRRTSSESLNLRGTRAGPPRAEGNHDDSSWLRKKYHDEELSVEEIGELVGVSATTILARMDDHGIERRTAAESREVRGTIADPRPGGPHRDEDWLREKYYDEELTMGKMADEAGLKSGVTILRWMERYGLERRETAEYLKKEGVRTAKHDNHEQVSFTASNGNTHYYDVHRLLAIAEFGLDEVAGKIVHHKNGIPWDNRPDNLELIESQAEHARLHSAERERDELGRYA